jgi:5-formyltetrahydrofolate cyclo-ligase
VSAAVGDWPTIRAWRKAERERLIAARLAIPRPERAAAEAAIAERLEALTRQAAPALVGFYWPFRGEFDGRPLARRLIAEGLRFALPVVVAKGQPLEFREWRPGIPMTHGIWNIPIPAAGPPVAPDLAWVPLVGFDAGCYRLGYGGGFYDRTLAAARPRPRTVGIGYDVQRLDSIAPQPHDIPMDTILTPTLAMERPASA